MSPPPNTKILVIDDSQGILFIMRQALELKKYSVDVADRFEGIHLVQEKAPDLIFLDVSLIETDGSVVCRQLKSHAATKHIPIILLTGRPQPEQLMAEAGADDYLAKPFSLTDLWEKVTTHAPAL